MDKAAEKANSGREGGGEPLVTNCCQTFEGLKSLEICHSKLISESHRLDF